MRKGREIKALVCTQDNLSFPAVRVGRVNVSQLGSLLLPSGRLYADAAVLITGENLINSQS